MQNCGVFFSGSDTVVAAEGKIYGKPKSEQHAFDTLSKLR